MYLNLGAVIQFMGDTIQKSCMQHSVFGDEDAMRIAKLAKQIENLRLKTYDPLKRKRKCYGFRDWEIVKENRPLDYSKITENLFGISSRYLASVDVLGCISSCFFCWVDWENEYKFKVRFYSHDEIYKRLLNLKGNIWRLTGGEPLIVPELPLEICTKLYTNNLQKVFWLETNLLPLAVYHDFPRKLSEYKKVVVHCSIKGADPESYERITGLDGEYYKQTLLGLRSLIENGIEVFPSLLVNALPPEKLELLFEDLLEIHSKLPLRVMIRRVLPYVPTVRRIKESRIKLYSFNECLQRWNRMLIESYGIRYIDVQRWKIEL
jgi:uncharacterized Fe-S cluster-containing radical SAM superfamily protein